MKRVYIILSMLLIGLLAACGNTDTRHPIHDVYDALDITLSEGDSKNQVTKNFDLVTVLNGAVIEWFTSKTSVIKIQDGEAIVIRGESDQTVTLTAIIKLDGEQLNKQFNLTVLKKEADPIDPVDPVDPDPVDPVDPVDPDPLDPVDPVDPDPLDPVDPGDLNSVTFTETFDNLGLTLSSYESTTFIGAYGIEWIVTGARGDIDLNGKALTFGGKADDQSSLFAVLDGGITSFSLKHKMAFSTIVPYGVYINGVKVVDIVATSLVQTLTFTLPTPIQGEYTFEIKPNTEESSRKQLTIDDLTITTYDGAPSNGSYVPVDPGNPDPSDGYQSHTDAIEDIVYSLTGSFDYVSIKNESKYLDYIYGTTSYQEIISMYNEQMDMDSIEFYYVDVTDIDVYVGVAKLGDIYFVFDYFVLGTNAVDVIKVATGYSEYHVSSTELTTFAQLEAHELLSTYVEYFELTTFNEFLEFYTYYPELAKVYANTWTADYPYGDDAVVLLLIDGMYLFDYYLWF